MIPAALIEALQNAQRPIFIWGAGIRPYADAALSLARSLGIPIATTWGAIDLVKHDDPLMAGGFGTHGTRGANFAVQNSDLIISIGSRLDTKATGHPPHFARAARIAMVDIDAAEINKFDKLGRTIDFPICADAGDFIAHLRMRTGDILFPVSEHFVHWSEWRIRIEQWKQRYSNPAVDWPGINPYDLMKEIAKWTTPEDVIVSDTGCALGWLMQGFPFKGERFIHAFNMTPMGYGLPAAIGAHYATSRRVILITGDGSIMMSLPELATISRNALPIKVILLNNQGHAMCRQTQRQWLGGTYPGTSVEGGLGFPNFMVSSRSFGIDCCMGIEYLLDDLDRECTPGFMEIKIHPDAQLVPQAKYGQPLEDADPQLPRDEFRAQMIVSPL